MARGRWVSLSVRLAAGLMVVAGVASVAASIERWWPQCRLGRFDSAGCVILQDNRYDYIVPSDPWVPVGSAATLAGIGGLLMGVGLVLLLPSHAVHRDQRVLAPVIAVLAFVTLHDGAATFLSGRAGRPVDVALLSGLRGPWEILVPLALAALVFRLRLAGSAWRTWRGLGPLVASLILACPLVELMALPISHDTPPWSGALSGTWLVFAGWAAWWLPELSGRRSDGEGRAVRPAH